MGEFLKKKTLDWTFTFRLSGLVPFRPHGRETSFFGCKIKNLSAVEF